RQRPDLNILSPVGEHAVHRRGQLTHDVDRHADDGRLVQVRRVEVNVQQLLAQGVPIDPTDEDRMGRAIQIEVDQRGWTDVPVQPVALLAVDGDRAGSFHRGPIDDTRQQALTPELSYLLTEHGTLLCL